MNSDVARARITVAREAGHDANCAMAFAARLRAQAAAVRNRLAISPCLCRVRRAPSWLREEHWTPCEWCGWPGFPKDAAHVARMRFCCDDCRYAAWRDQQRRLG